MTTRRQEDPSAGSSPFLTGVQPDPLPTYQELLDEAIELTFPASDPISPSAAMRTKRPIATPMDETDWELEADGAPEPRHDETSDAVDAPSPQAAAPEAGSETGPAHDASPGESSTST